MIINVKRISMIFFLGLVILIENFIYYSSFALVGYSLGKNVRDKDADVSFFVLSKLNKNWCQAGMSHAVYFNLARY